MKRIAITLLLIIFVVLPIVSAKPLTISGRPTSKTIELKENYLETKLNSDIFLTGDHRIFFYDYNTFIRSPNVGYLTLNSFTEILLQNDENTIATISSTGMSINGVISGDGSGLYNLPSTGGGNSSFNQTLTDMLYAKINNWNFGNYNVNGSGNVTANVISGRITRGGIIAGNVTTAAATAAKVATIPDYVLTTGDMLAINFTLGNSAASPTLNVNSAGAKPINVGSTAASAVTFTVGNGAVVLLYYNGNSFTLMGSQRTTDTDTDNYDRMYWGITITAGDPIYDYKLMMQSTDGKFYPLTKEEGTGTLKNISQVGFLLNSPILYYATTTNVAKDGTLSNAYSQISMTTLSYTDNQASRTNQLPIYLKGRVNATGLFVLDNSTFTSFITQTLPTTDDGFVYMQLGQMYATTSMKLLETHPIYHYSDGRLRLYADTAGISRNISLNNSVGTKCDMNFTRGILVSSNC